MSIFDNDRNTIERILDDSVRVKNYSTYVRGTFPYSSEHLVRYRELIKNLKEFKTLLLDNSITKYVVISRNSGSCATIYRTVGLLTKVSKIDNIDKIIDIIEDSIKNKVILTGLSAYYRHVKNNNIELIETLLSEIKVTFKCPGYYKDVEKKVEISRSFMLKNISISTKPHTINYVVHEAVSRPKKKLEDKFGEELAVGSLVIYADKDYSGPTTCIVPRIGNITSISKSNTIYCKNIKLSNTDKVVETRIKNNQSLFLLSDDIKDKLMISKLTF